MKRVKITFVFRDPDDKRRLAKKAPIECHTVEGVVQESELNCGSICSKLLLTVKKGQYCYQLRNGQAPQVFVGQRVILHLVSNMIVGIEFLNEKKQVILRVLNLNSVYPEAALQVRPLG